jgi:hypothetical protein
MAVLFETLEFKEIYPFTAFCIFEKFPAILEQSHHSLNSLLRIDLGYRVDCLVD